MAPPPSPSASSAADGAPSPRTRGVLFTVVVSLGVCILAGIGMIGYGMVKTLEDPEWRLFGDGANTATSAPEAAGGASLSSAASLRDITLALPEGCRVRDVRAEDSLVYVLTEPAGVCGFVVIVDMERQAVIGRLRP